MKRWLILGLLVFAITAVPAQEEKKPEYGWKNEVVGNLNFTQNSFSNWAAGGEDSWSWQLDVLARFVNDRKDYTWANSGKLSFGKTQVGDAEARKAADEINLESVFTYKMDVYMNPFVAITAKTQLAKGYSYDVSPKAAVAGFFDPGYVTESIGLGYNRGEGFKTRFGAALKHTFTSDFPVPYADDPSTMEIEDTKTEFGAESVTDFSTKLSETILFTSKLEMFSNLKALNQIDINWDNLFSAKLTEYISVSFNIKLFYDRDISIRRQLRQTLAAGLTYSVL